MFCDDDATYFAGRAVQERRLAAIAADTGARDAHRQMAELYAAKSGEHQQSEYPALVAFAR